MEATLGFRVWSKGCGGSGYPTEGFRFRAWSERYYRVSGLVKRECG